MDFDELDQLLNAQYEPSEAFLIFDDASDPTRFTGLFSDDPMRQVLRPMLLGFDAAPEAPNEEDLAAVNYTFYSQNKKRELCLNAVKEAMMHFQSAYGSISSSYAQLRSKLLSPL